MPAMSAVSDLWSLTRQCLCLFFRPRRALILENNALRSQLALFEHQVITGTHPKPQPTPAFRLLWVWLSTHWPAWRSALMIVKPETVIRWHRLTFR